jgi:hypothetical protein
MRIVQVLETSNKRETVTSETRQAVIKWTGAVEVMDGGYEVLRDEMRQGKMQGKDESKGRGDVWCSRGSLRCHQYPLARGPSVGNGEAYLTTLFPLRGKMVALLAYRPALNAQAGTARGLAHSHFYPCLSRPCGAAETRRPVRYCR